MNACTMNVFIVMCIVNALTFVKYVKRLSMTKNTPK